MTKRDDQAAQAARLQAARTMSRAAGTAGEAVQRGEMTGEEAMQKVIDSLGADNN